MARGGRPIRCIPLLGLRGLAEHRSSQDSREPFGSHREATPGTNISLALDRTAWVSRAFPKSKIRTCSSPEVVTALWLVFVGIGQGPAQNPRSLKDG